MLAGGRIRHASNGRHAWVHSEVTVTSINLSAGYVYIQLGSPVHRGPQFASFQVKISGFCNLLLVFIDRKNSYIDGNFNESSGWTRRTFLGCLTLIEDPRCGSIVSDAVLVLARQDDIGFVPTAVHIGPRFFCPSGSTPSKAKPGMAPSSKRIDQIVNLA